MDTIFKSVSINEFKGSDKEYHALKTHLSASGMKILKQSPAHFANREEEEQESDALRFGSAYHCLILQPENFESEFYVFDDSAIIDILIGEGFKNPRATNKYKEWQEAEMAKVGVRTTLSKDEYKRMERMRNVLMSHPYAKKLLTGGVAEQGYIGTLHTDEGDIDVKIKPDYQKEKGKLIIDLKTTRDASRDGFPRLAADGNYHIQAAFYSDVLEAYYNDGMSRTFIFIAQEKVAPYAFNLFECSPQFITQGRYEYSQLLKLYKHCLDNDDWRGYQVFCESRYGLLDLELPPYTIRPLEFYKHK